MTDESKVKTTFIRPVNRTMSYEDRRGYVYVYVYVTVTRVVLVSWPRHFKCEFNR